MDTQIYLAFVDDWELRGDGSGDPTNIQFPRLRELTRLFAERSIRGSFCAEVMQQLTFRRFQGQYPHLKDWADEWERVVTEAFRQGHDFQLHIHPQWKGASYDGVRWSLPAPWSILDHPRKDAARMIGDGINLLQGLLQPVQPEYRCISFRAGAWCIAPSEFMLDLLASQDIQFDISILKGICFHSPVQLDDRHVEEGFFPFYPDMQDARRVSDRKQPIVCIPTICFPEDRWTLFYRDARTFAGKVFGTRNRTRRPSSAAVDTAATPYRQWAPKASLPIRLLQKFRTYLTGRWIISDIAQLDYDQLTRGLRYVRRMANRSGLAEVPVILSSHTKDIEDFGYIERFLDDIATAPDIRCVTLAELGRMLARGSFPIRTKSSR
jgi:hypothetical protein